MTWKDWLNTTVSAAIAGGVAAIIPLVTTQPINWKLVGSSFLAGALIGVVSHFRTPPGSTTIPNQGAK